LAHDFLIPSIHRFRLYPHQTLVTAVHQIENASRQSNGALEAIGFIGAERSR